MLDLHWIRNHLPTLEKMLQQRNSPLSLSQFQTLDQQHRHLQTQLQQLQEQKNQLKHQLKHPKQYQSPRQYRKIKKQIQQLKSQKKQIQQLLEKLLHKIPNKLLPSVPTQKKILKQCGQTLPFCPKPYHKILPEAHLLQKGKQLTQTQFLPLNHPFAQLQRALINFMLDLHTHQHHYQEISPPLLVNTQTAFATGHLPKFQSQMYSTQKNQLYLIPTAELPLVGYHQNEIIPQHHLPIKYVAATPCFRKETSSKPQGLYRLHQFHKVELVQLTHPNHSQSTLQSMIAESEKILQLLQIPYQLVELHAPELSFSAAYTCDLEVWCYSQQRYLEVASLSNCLDFQARRAKIRFRDQQNQLHYVHTLNGSALALPRLLIAFLEHHQTPNGKIQIPPPLQPYLHRKELP